MGLANGSGDPATQKQVEQVYDEIVRTRVDLSTAVSRLTSAIQSLSGSINISNAVNQETNRLLGADGVKFPAKMVYTLLMIVVFAFAGGTAFQALKLNVFGLP